MSFFSVSKRPFKSLDRFGGRHPVILILIFVLLILTGAGLWAYQRPLPVVQPTLDLKSQAASSANLPPPNLVWSPYGEQAIGVAGQNLTLTHGNQKALPMASVTKVVTCLAILQKKPISLGQRGPTITLTQADVNIYNADLVGNQSIVPVTAGEQITEYQALQAILLPSATNVATSLAVWAFGSLDNFLAYTNQMAHNNGWDDTHLVDASGFLPGSVSSPSDLLKIGAEAMRDPVIAQIVGQKTVTLPVVGIVKNFNIVLGQSGITGIKTGNTDQAGGVFLYAAPYGSLTLIGITMGAPDLGTALHDAPEIINSFEKNVTVQSPVKAGQAVAHYDLPWGGTVGAAAQKDVSVLAWQGAKPAINSAVRAIAPSASHAGDLVGSVGATFNGQAMSSPVVLRQNPPAPSFWWRLFR